MRKELEQQTRTSILDHKEKYPKRDIQSDIYEGSL